MDPRSELMTYATWFPREFTKRGHPLRFRLFRFSSEHFMAFQQAANKGTLVPGQTISVNKYTVQVERYLSQGLIFHPSFNDSDPL